MSEQARELAELMGWKRGDDCWVNPEGAYNLNDPNYVPAYDTDLNAMREVWVVLKERGLWNRFIKQWNKSRGYAGDMYDFLNDLPGQVTAAIKVLKA